jgi:hypothetical protein
MEFNLGADVRRGYGLRAIRMIVLAAVVGGLGSALSTVLAVVGAVIALAALIPAAQWFSRIRALTVVGPEGIRTRMWRTREIPWSEIKQVQEVDFERMRRVGVASGRLRGASRGRNSGGGNKKVACVRLVRHHGRTVELAAPLVVRDSADHTFDDKVRALRSAHAFYTGDGAKTPAAAR